MKTKKIFKLDVARKLQQMGNFIVKTVPNTFKEGFVVYIFVCDEKLEADLTTITEEFKK